MKSIPELSSVILTVFHVISPEIMRMESFISRSLPWILVIWISHQVYFFILLAINNQLFRSRFRLTSKNISHIYFLFGQVIILSHFHSTIDNFTHTSTALSRSAQGWHFLMSDIR